MRALSLRQPLAELVLLKKKKIEYRTIQTNLRERVYLYAAKQPFENEEAWRRAGANPGELPVGVLVGTVEIVDCAWNGVEFEWRLARPIRFAKPLKPKRMPQPIFFRPF